MTAHELAIRHLQNELTETQINYWLHVSGLAREDFDKAVQSIINAQQDKSLGCLVIVLAIAVTIFIWLFN